MGEKRQDTGARMEGADLARTGVLVPPSTGLALSIPLALGPQFLLSIAREMKEVPGTSWAEPWRAPNLSHCFVDERTKGQRSCVSESPMI